ncbi:MAG TPA: DsrE family protein [Nitrospinota bacterium]|jgi:uncharacterized protein involved in oxidation of intracellular sulfur|nr:DsrE family protein [Nitrospinota bacterium]|tara:strand:- start:49318 stop:49674 length:357 start_codon:yes stop_codon:yes gene_type:complete
MANKMLFILNDPPYGTERSYNGLRLAGSLGKREGEEIKIFLMGDAASCGKSGQKTPDGYYNLEKMFKVIARQGGTISVCGTCMDARGITEAELSKDCSRGNLIELTDAVQWADKVLIF